MHELFSRFLGRIAQYHRTGERRPDHMTARDLQACIKEVVDRAPRATARPHDWCRNFADLALAPAFLVGWLGRSDDPQRPWYVTPAGRAAFARCENDHEITDELHEAYVNWQREDPDWRRAPGDGLAAAVASFATTPRLPDKARHFHAALALAGEPCRITPDARAIVDAVAALNIQTYSRGSGDPFGDDAAEQELEAILCDGIRAGSLYPLKLAESIETLRTRVRLRSINLLGAAYRRHLETLRLDVPLRYLALDAATNEWREQTTSAIEIVERCQKRMVDKGFGLQWCAPATPPLSYAYRAVAVTFGHRPMRRAIVDSVLARLGFELVNGNTAPPEALVVEDYPSPKESRRVYSPAQLLGSLASGRDLLALGPNQAKFAPWMFPPAGLGKPERREPPSDLVRANCNPVTERRRPIYSRLFAERPTDVERHEIVDREIAALWDELSDFGLAADARWIIVLGRLRGLMPLPDVREESIDPTLDSGRFLRALLRTHRAPGDPTPRKTLKSINKTLFNELLRMGLLP